MSLPGFRTYFFTLPLCGNRLYFDGRYCSESGCSKLTTSLIYVSLNFVKVNIFR